MPHVNAFDDALIWFDALRHQAKIEFEREFVEVASQPDTANVGTSGDSTVLPDAPDLSVHSIPSTLRTPYTMPNATHASRYLSEKCPACFGGIVWGSDVHSYAIIFRL
jgi:hypothetical protein